MQWALYRYIYIYMANVVCAWGVDCFDVVAAAIFCSSFYFAFQRQSNQILFYPFNVSILHLIQSFYYPWNSMDFTGIFLLCKTHSFLLISTHRFCCSHHLSYISVEKKGERIFKNPIFLPSFLDSFCSIILYHVSSFYFNIKIRTNCRERNRHISIFCPREIWFSFFFWRYKKWVL